MIREFRAWHEKDKKFITDDKYLIGLNGKIYFIGNEDCYCDVNCDKNNLTLIEQDNIILSQFTGLKDKNGVKIYEGDVVKKQGGSFIVDLNTGKKYCNHEGIFQIMYNQLHNCYGLFDLGGGFKDFILASEYDKKGKRASTWIKDFILASEYDKKGKRASTWISYDLEIVGSIYENPELLEENA